MTADQLAPLLWDYFGPKSPRCLEAIWLKRPQPASEKQARAYRRAAAEIAASLARSSEWECDCFRLDAHSRDVWFCNKCGRSGGGAIERICQTCERPFTVVPEPSGEWPNCLAPDCASHDPARDLDGVAL